MTCDNCKKVKESLDKLLKTNGFGMIGSLNTVKCKQGHYVYEEVN